MRYYISPIKFLLQVLVLVLFTTAGAEAEGISVRKAEIRKVGEGFQLSANFDIKLAFVVEQALNHGTTLNFVSEFNLTSSRWYWFDEVAAKTEQTTKLSYSPLTRQYRIKRGSLYQNFATLEEALQILGNQSSNPLPEALFTPSEGTFSFMMPSKSNYTAVARMRLDLSQLPKPLQVNALTNDEWKLDSEGYSWVLSAEEIESARKQP